MEIEKGQTWGSVKTKAEAKIELSQSYEKVGWKLGGKDGAFLEDLSIFNEDVVVYATSKLISTVKMLKLNFLQA